MRDEIAEMIKKHRVCIDWATYEVQLADQILSLIEGQRCEWVQEKEYRTPSCRGGISFGKKWDFPYCPCCGKRIEVKDAR